MNLNPTIVEQPTQRNITATGMGNPIPAKCTNLL